ncbi:hypothetical protein CLV59_103495 [Chitinophaga dinghuensis]|uniref:Uncharacterized protein n=1 Tax=Chitinophaga dinghuensis TaxID=1539050 RepID=A0A327W2M6_9BACT|nr:type VI secretion system TssO [Chitinophaga dinghuensis]RAJ83527.1 hypothetical protein CLV59_103495 [Chitinophaga dinghuensis]
MEPLNSQIRRKGFLLFLLFYLLTTGLLILGVFLYYQVPVAENNMLRSELIYHGERWARQQQFSDGLGKVKQELSTVNDPGQNSSYVDQLIATTLAGMRNHISPKESGFNFYDDILQCCLSLQQSKQQLRECRDAQQTIMALRMEVSQLQQQLDGKSRELENCRLLMMANHTQTSP